MAPENYFRRPLLLQVLRSWFERRRKAPPRPSPRSLRDIPDYLLDDMGLPAPNRRVKAKDPPPLDPWRYM